MAIELMLFNRTRIHQRIHNEETGSHLGGAFSESDEIEPRPDDYESLEELVSRLPWNVAYAVDRDLHIDIDEILQSINKMPGLASHLTPQSQSAWRNS